VELTDTSSHEPYPGLRSFRKSESDIFFGRDDHLDEMIVKLTDHNFLCITGPSGCGKSSLARTGLMNHLEAGFLPGRGSDWIFCDFHPGDQPNDNLFRRLAAAIAAEVKSYELDVAEGERAEQIRQLFRTATQRRSADLNEALGSIAGIDGRPIMILVDQFEELFRYSLSDSDAAVNFVEILVRTVRARRDIYIVITIRTDELEKCSRYPELTKLINESQFLTPALDRYQIQEAIENPIALWNGKITREFSTFLLNCLEDEFDRLPLMQHALKVLYTKKRAATGRSDVTIGVEDFIRVFELPQDIDLSSSQGRVALRNSLSDRLTQRYNGLPDHLKASAARAFCALTAVDSPYRDIRRPCKLGELASIIGESVEDTRTIVRAFSEGDEVYLRTTVELAENDTVDVTHECLLRLWSKLQTEWLVDEKNSAENVKLLAKLARDWENSSEKWSGIRRFFTPTVLRGYTRVRYQEWFDGARPNAAWAARYLAGFNWPAPQRGPGQKLTPKEIFERIGDLLAASKWHLVRARIGLGFVSVCVLGLIGFISKQQADNYRQRVNFHAQQERAENERAVTSGLLPEQMRVHNAQAALKALKKGLSDYGAVWAGLQQIQEVHRFKLGDEKQDQVRAADFAPDAKSIVAIDYGGVLHQWALTSGTKVVWESSIGPPDAKGTPAQGRSLRVSSQGVAAVGFSDGSVVLVDLTSSPPRTQALQIDGHKPHRSPDPGRRSSVFKLVFSPDGSLLVTTSRSGNIAIWQQSPSQAEAEHRAPADRLRWISRRNVDLDALLQPADIWAVDIDRTKQQIAIGLTGGRVCLLRVDGPDRPVCSTAGHTEGKTVKSVAFMPDRPILLSAGNDDHVTIWNADAITGQLTPWPIALYQDADIWDIDLSHDGSLLATASWDGSVRIYQTATWRLLNTVAADRFGHRRREIGTTAGKSTNTSFALRTVRFDPTSNMLVTSSLDHTARVWAPLWDQTSLLDLSTRLRPAGNSPVHEIVSVALAPSGKRVAFTDGTVVFLRSSGENLKRLTVPEDGLVKRVADRETKPLRFGQVLMPSEDEVLASAEEPRLAHWTRAATGEWESQILELRGDAIPDGRSIAVDRRGVTLAVEVREDEKASILLCRRPDIHQPWTCPADGFPTHFNGNGCAKDTHVVFTLAKSGRWLAAGAGPCPIEVFDTRNASVPPRSLRVNEDFKLTALDFSPDEKALVGTSNDIDDPEVRVWDFASGTSRNINHHFSPKITAAKYSPSGRWITSIARDNTIIVSSADTGEKLVSLRYRNSLLALDLAATERGTLIAVGSEAGDVNVARFFENKDEITSYATSVLQDISD
jgi:WD40 repeat protein/energy-coupling factor transporter ATP-binding protein EcfA2